MSQPQEKEYNFAGDESVRCRGKGAWDRDGKKGWYFGWVRVGERCWAVVLWDGEDDPDLVKAESIEIASETWISPTA